MRNQKRNIQTRFTRSITSYDGEALAQTRIAQKLASLLPLNINVQRAMEVGCGTGLFTRLLLERFPTAQWYINDLVAGLEPLLQPLFQQADKPVVFMPGDAESLVFPEKMEMVASASTVQWFDDLPAFLKKSAGALNENGILAFSTFGPDNFNETRSISEGGLDYLSVEEMTTMVGECFEPETIEQEYITLYFENPQEVLRHLKLTGVNATGCRGWTRNDLNCFCDAYENRYKGEKGVSLTYHPIYVIARKK